MLHQTEAAILTTTRPSFKNTNTTCLVLLMSHGTDVARLESVEIAQVMNVLLEGPQS